MNFTARDLRNRDNHLLRRVERQQIQNQLCANQNLNFGKVQKKFDLKEDLKEFKKELKENKSNFKSNVFFEETFTKLGTRGRKR